YRLACDIKNLEEFALRELVSYEKTPKGQIEIITTPGTIHSWLIPALATFLHKYEDVQINIRGQNEPFYFQTQMGDVFIGPWAGDDPDLEKIYMRSYTFKLFASQKYLKRFGYPKDYDDLDHHRLISFAGGEHTAFGDPDWFLRSKNTYRRPYMKINSSFCLIIAAQHDLGIITSRVE